MLATPHLTGPRGATALLIGLLASGCADLSAARQARYRALIGQTELTLVQQLGVPSGSYSVGDRKFLAYDRSRYDVLPGFGFGGFGGWGWDGGWNAAVPPETVYYRCSTTFELSAGTVVGFTERGNACG